MRAIFRAGNYPQGNYTEKDIDGMISTFNSESAGVPLTVDHKKEGIALGWVDALRRKGNTLFASFRDMDSRFAEAVERKRYKNVSAEIRETDKGKRLRAVSFLGAKIPEIKDLEAEYSFSEEDEIVCIHFTEDSMELENKVKELEKSLLEKEKELKEFSEKGKALEGKYKDLTEKVAKDKKERREKEIKEFCELLTKEGKTYPAELPLIETTLRTLDDESVKEFMDFDENGKASKVSQSEYEQYKFLLGKRDKVVEFGEKVPDNYKKTYDFANEEGDSESTKLFAEAEKLSKEKNITLDEACKIVSAGK